MMNDETTAGATATSPTCGLTGCGVKVGKGGLCTGCRSVNYCSKEHQRRDWPSHKLKCRAIKKGEPPCNPVNQSKITEISCKICLSSHKLVFTFSDDAREEMFNV